MPVFHEFVLAAAKPAPGGELLLCTGPAAYHI
jgi:hypothetical protein